MFIWGGGDLWGDGEGREGLCVCIYVYVCVYTYMCVCVCVRPYLGIYRLEESALG